MVHASNTFADTKLVEHTTFENGNTPFSTKQNLLPSSEIIFEQECGLAHCVHIQLCQTTWVHDSIVSHTAWAQGGMASARLMAVSN